MFKKEVRRGDGCLVAVTAVEEEAGGGEALFMTGGRQLLRPWK